MSGLSSEPLASVGGMPPQGPNLGGRAERVNRSTHCRRPGPGSERLVKAGDVSGQLPAASRPSPPPAWLWPVSCFIWQHSLGMTPASVTSLCVAFREKRATTCPFRRTCLVLGGHRVGCWNFLSRAAFSCSPAARSLTAARGPQSRSLLSSGQPQRPAGWDWVLWSLPEKGVCVQGPHTLPSAPESPAGLLSVFISLITSASVKFPEHVDVLAGPLPSSGRQVPTLQEAQCRGSAGGRAPTRNIPEDLGDFLLQVLCASLTDCPRVWEASSLPSARGSVSSEPLVF